VLLKLENEDIWERKWEYMRLRLRKRRKSKVICEKIKEKKEKVIYIYSVTSDIKCGIRA